MFLDDLVERNRKWAAKRQAEPLPKAQPMPLAVVGCFDPRLDNLLRPALGLGEDEGLLVRTAGAVVTPGALRSLIVAVYLFDVHQVLVVGHSSCKMAEFPTTEFIDAFRRRGVSRSAFGADDLRTWVGAIPSPRQGVLASVATIARAPQLPSDLAVAGAVLDDTSGKLEVVFRPGDVLPLEATPPADRTPVSGPPRAAARPAEPEAPGPPGAVEPAGRKAKVVEPPAPPPVPSRSVASTAARRRATPQSPLQALLPVIEDLTKNRGLGDQVFRLRAALERESNPMRQLLLLQRFVKGAAVDSPEIRQAFELLKREATAGPRVVAEFVLPLLTGRRRR